MQNRCFSLEVSKLGGPQVPGKPKPGKVAVVEGKYRSFNRRRNSWLSFRSQATKQQGSEESTGVLCDDPFDFRSQSNNHPTSEALEEVEHIEKWLTARISTAASKHYGKNLMEVTELIIEHMAFIRDAKLKEDNWKWTLKFKGERICQLWIKLEELSAERWEALTARKRELIAINSSTSSLSPSP
ncbi:hypothetical protein ONE63_004706 [Megalurothrips usitatus]|uniref:Uncharacterized protein n=1 Tax=Megalurothrips usitatus TaxID=439358 RepID=A0AAV7X0J8_9NEOP|nr:hypothetical protein ONE63_004706 [Megalurothrips usitatus]